MQIVNLTENLYELPGIRLHASETIEVESARYLGDEAFRHLINTLYGNGKISVAETPDGFPISTASEAELTAEGVVNGGSQLQSQTATITTDPNTFTASHIFDLDVISMVMMTATLLSVDYDGETGGLAPGEVVFDILSFNEGWDGVTFPGVLETSWDLDTPYTGDGSDLPLLTHRKHGIVSRYGRATGHVIDGSSFDPWAGPSHPQASWRIDLTYR